VPTFVVNFVSSPSWRAQPSVGRSQIRRRLAEDDIRAPIISLGDLRDVIRAAGAAEKAAIYQQLELQVTYLPDKTNSGLTSGMYPKRSIARLLGSGRREIKGEQVFHEGTATVGRD
jgi:hypothetical protein